MSKKIKKALDENEINALANIQSLIGELMQMNQASVDSEDEDVMKEEMVEDKKEKITEEDIQDAIAKALEETPTDAATASDSAEDRIDENQPEINEENISEVAKMLVALTRKSKVKKSSLYDSIESLVKIQKSNMQKTNELETALNHVLDGLGVAKQLEVAKQEIKKSKPVDTNNEDVINYIRKALGREEKPSSNYISNGDVVHKNLSDATVLKGLLGGQFRKGLSKFE